MAWDSDTFINGLTSWLSANITKSDDDTANEIGRLYGISAKSVNPKSPSWPSTPTDLKSDDIIAGGFSASFKLARALSIGSFLTVTPVTWAPAAASIISYWGGVNFSLVPPPPGGLTGASNSISSPGSPVSLAINIGESFKQGDAAAVASSLNNAILTHLGEITGSWNGTAPGAPPPAFSLPWNGLQ